MRWTNDGAVARPQCLAPSMVRGGGWDLERANGRKARRERTTRFWFRSEGARHWIADRIESFARIVRGDGDLGRS